MDTATADRYIADLEREGRRLLEAAARDLAAKVDSCPGWDVARLVVHMGQVHRYMATLLAEPTLEAPSHRFERPADDDDVVAWAQASLESIVARLRVTDPTTPSWTFGPDETAGFFHRRMAMETLVHRMDAEDAVGHPSEVDSDLAADGVDEYLEIWFQSSAQPDTTVQHPAGSLHLHRTDGAGEWFVEATDGVVAVTREHRKGDVAVRGSGPSLLRWIWNRPGADVEVLGDADLADAWRNTRG